MSATPKQIDIVCAGELLIDLISENFADHLDEADNFKRIQGGSPANLGMNMARLGKKVQLVASVGQDDMGTFLLESVQQLDMSTASIARRPQPTTLILVTRSKEVSNFEAYRGADCQIHDEQLPKSLLQSTRLFHTTCFGLSQSPAQATILAAARKAHQFGAQLSIDVNYAQKIWSDQATAQRIVADYCSQEAIVKVSEVDWARLYGHQFEKAEVVGQHFLNLGARAVCLTLGGEGVWVFSKTAHHFLPPRPVKVRDTTGAGDAFWSGFLTAWLENATLLDCAKAGRNMAEFKIQRFGTLDQKVPIDILAD
ncbi:MAG: PfkB family carbohydrate kinase [Bacteroidota bacterium]